jgi:hypothetical protein
MRKRSTPAHAIITPLSVHKCGGGHINGTLYCPTANDSKLKS